MIVDQTKEDSMHDLQYESDSSMYGFAISLFFLVINLAFVIGYFGLYVILQLNGLFLDSSEEGGFWEDDETQLHNDFITWMHSWSCIILLFNLCLMSYFQLSIIQMSREDETLFYLHGKARKTIGAIFGMNVLCIGFVFFVC